MRYVLQVYFGTAQARTERLPKAARQAVVDEYVAFFASPEIRDGNQLQPPATAVTVRVQEGATVRSAGPFAAAEPLGGYYLVDAPDLDAAVALAARIPAARMGGAVEVRPIVRDVEDLST